MTDETTTAQDDLNTEDESINLATLWGSYFISVEPLFVSNTLNKRDIQQYRLKAADVATALTQMTLVYGGKR
mgnify:CR=1 FL=1